MTTYTVQIGAYSQNSQIAQAMAPRETVTDWTGTIHELAEEVAGRQTIASSEAGDWYVDVRSDSGDRVMWNCLHRPDRENVGDAAYIDVILREWSNRLEAARAFREEGDGDRANRTEARWYAHYSAELAEIGYRVEDRPGSWPNIVEGAVAALDDLQVIAV